ncbi:MAG: hypothetical protein II931_05645 [Clostridia bacterium]|nr:hypothetical protein [Clostridia bacterium]
MSMTDNKHFDERQILARGRGFQIGFLTALAMTVLDLLSEDFLFESSVGINVYSRAMLCIWIPITVVSIYFILNDAYEKINETGGRVLMGMFILVGLVEIIVTIVRTVSGSDVFIENGIVGDALGQFCTGAAMLGIAAVYFVKQAINRNRFEEE